MDNVVMTDNVTNIIQNTSKNKFLDKYNNSKKTDTEQLLSGLPEFVIKDLVLYFFLVVKFSIFSDIHVHAFFWGISAYGLFCLLEAG